MVRISISSIIILEVLSNILLQSVLAEIDYNNIRQANKESPQNGKRFFIQYFYPSSNPISTQVNFMMYCLPNNHDFYLPQVNYFHNFTPIELMFQQQPVLPEQAENFTAYDIQPKLLSLKVQSLQTIEGLSSPAIRQNPSAQLGKSGFRKCQKVGIQEIKLDFRIQWKNENRNIVPNLVNQMMSFLLKKIKSQKLMMRLFKRHPHPPSCSLTKFYLYMKKIKDSISHYVNQSVIQYFFQIHEPNCHIYSEEEQRYYMKLCRIAIHNFLQTDSIIISLTSSRMSQAKRKTHLIAREALLNKFLQLAQWRNI